MATDREVGEYSYYTLSELVDLIKAHQNSCNEAIDELVERDARIGELEDEVGNWEITCGDLQQQVVELQEQLAIG